MTEVTSPHDRSALVIGNSAMPKTDEVRTPKVRLPDIIWVVRSADCQYGYVGNIKLFSIHRHPPYYRLDPRIPTHKGTWTPSEEARDIDTIKAIAERLYREWIRQLETPYTGQFLPAEDSPR